MIIDSKEVVETNLTNSVQFGVSENSAKIFSFLSNFLYTDKERSVITELTSNALDAHIEAGKAHEPIQVTFPTSLCPELKIRDFGLGLHEENVYRYLTKYGESSKSNTNDMIGGFGIGSKSPAAVTSTWTINSFHAGLHTQYLIHVGENGIPAINKLFSTETPETGLEVIVPVKPHQISRWAEAGNEALKFYSPMPICKGVRTPPKPVEILFDGVNIFTLASPSYYDTTSAVINRRDYPIKWEKIDGPNKNFYSNIRTLKGHLKFKTGELSVSLSREDLQYDKKTIEAIDAKCKLIVDEFAKYWATEVSPASGLIDYMLRMVDFGKKYTSQQRNLFGTLAVLNGDKFSGVSYDDEYFSLPIWPSPTPIIQFVNNSVGCRKVNHNYGNRSLTGMKLANIYNKNTSMYDTYLKFRMVTRDSLVFVSRDTKNTPSRVKQYLIGKPDVECVIVDPSVYATIPNDFNKVLSSSLDKVVVVRTPKSAKVVSPVYEIRKNHFYPIEVAAIDQTADNIVCVKFTKANTTSSVDAASERFLNSPDLRKHAIVIAVRASDNIPSYAKSPTEFAEKLYAKIMTKKNEIELSHLKSKLMNMWQGPIKYMTEFCGVNTTHLKSLTKKKDSVYNTTVDKIHTAMSFKDHDTLKKELSMLKSLEHYLNKPSMVLNIENIEEAFYNAYPLLKYAESSRLNHTTFKPMIEYIDFCDNQ